MTYHVAYRWDLFQVEFEREVVGKAAAIALKTELERAGALSVRYWPCKAGRCTQS